MKWRYQVIAEIDAYYIIEVYLDKDDRLEAWGEEITQPLGETKSQIVRDLSRMLHDALQYKPVRKIDLKVGMKFELED